jgi:hypothetical protein
VDVVIHCYRCAFGLEAGDPALQPLEDLLAQKPTVKVTTVTIDGATDPLKPGGTAEDARMFVGCMNTASMRDTIFRSRRPSPSPTR